MNVLTRRTLAVAAVLAVVGGPAERATGQEPTGFRADLISDLTGVEQKYVALAEVLSPDQYSWRPMEGVRTAGEVFMHIAGANILFPTFIGIEASDDMGRALKYLTRRRSSKPSTPLSSTRGARCAPSRMKISIEPRRCSASRARTVGCCCS